MKKHIFKLRSRLCGQHVHTTIFANYGEDGSTLANCGTLTMNVSEWLVFGALLSLGAKGIAATVILEGDRGVVDTIATKEEQCNPGDKQDFREYRQCTVCGETWIDTGDLTCRFCGAPETEPVEEVQCPAT